MSLEMVQKSFDDNEVGKSYFPGKGWIPANKVPKRELRYMAHGGRRLGQEIERQNEKLHFGEYKQAHDSLRELARAVKGRKTNPKGKDATELRVPNMVANRIAGRHAQAFAFRTGGKKGGRYLVTRPNADQGTVNHELAHLEPKRSSYRLHQVVTDPKKRMREEARADMHAGPGGYYRDRAAPGSGYVQAARNNGTRKRFADVADNGGGTKGMFSKESMRDFKDTQDRIYNAGGHRTPKINYGTPEGGQRPVKHYVVGGTVAAGAGGGGYALHRKKKQGVSKAIRIKVLPATNARDAHLDAMARLRGTALQGAAVGQAHIRQAYKKAGFKNSAGEPRKLTMRELRLAADPTEREHMRFHAKRQGLREIGKSFQPWDGVRSEVSKMSPDQSALHVEGFSGQRRKARLRKLPPDAVRRV